MFYCINSSNLMLIAQVFLLTFTMVTERLFAHTGAVLSLQP